MSQSSISTYFNTRKRPAADDVRDLKKTPAENTLTTRSGRTIKRVGSTPLDSKTISPEKRTAKEKDVNSKQTFASKGNIINQGSQKTTSSELRSLVKKELNFEEVKQKISRSSKLQKLKESLNRIQELEKQRKEHENENRRLKEELPVPKQNVVALEEFKTIEMEILVSPVKTLKTPTKSLPSTPGKNELMSPKRTEISKRLIFSPSKDGSPSKLLTQPAHKRFLALSEKATIAKPPLPFKYRCLLEAFRSMDQMCALFFKRKECITFKKLKPAVQRILRKSFHETHLAQIAAILPDAFRFSQKKMRNYGSTSKSDYYQLIITPNISIATEDLSNSDECSGMSSGVLTQRLQRFENILMQRVQKEHQKFLASLKPPIILKDSENSTRWHPNFDLENIPDIERAFIPQPPNVQKYSSAKDVLTTARKLFNCATTMEGALERLESKQEEDKKLDLAEKCGTEETAEPQQLAENSILKGVSKSLLERIRQKQAAKALDAITRGHAQDLEATKYSRLPDLARYVWNVFVSEKRGVLSSEIVLKKIQNSLKTSLSIFQIEEHLRILAKECPEWIAFHDIRKTMYIKIQKNYDLRKIVEKLEELANEKSK